MSFKKLDFKYKSLLGYIVELHLAIVFLIIIILITDTIENEAISGVILFWSGTIVAISFIRYLIYAIDKYTKKENSLNNNIGLSLEQFSRLSYIAKELDRSKSETVDDLMELYLKNKNSLKVHNSVTEE